jgi:formylglycine-generating enzyme required for sulfatase activity
MVVTASTARAGRPAARAGELVFAAPLEEKKSVELALDEDGLQRVIFEGRRLGDGAEPLAEVDLRRELALVRDTHAPRAALEGWREGLVLRSAEELRARAFRVRAEDETFGPPPPLAVEWSLATRADGRAVELGSGELVLAPGASSPLPAGTFGALRDGRYALALRARDFAGNQDERREFTWSVSAEGPVLEVLVPAGGEVWARSSEVFAVELRAEDPNGVAAVECELADAGGVLPSRTLALAPLSSAAGVTRWTGRFELDHRWAGREIRLRFRARDADGTESLRPVEVACTVGPIPSLVPALVQVARPGSAPTRMRRVPGNAQVAYLFGGRGDFAENSAFRALGLPDFSDRTFSSSLRLECPPGSIADFYLDETEVSAAQGLEFLRASGGWTDGRWWEAPAPGEPRRLELERALAAGDPSLPATGLTCLEAQAFAAWSGKELPTYLHWEYAVRGPLARPYSFAARIDAAALGERVNVGSGEVWPVSRGDDRTPDTLVADLCSNVAEWTSTPVRGPLSALTVSELLEPARALTGARHYVVGGAFDRPAFHFGAIARRACADASPAIGFRCMLSAARVEAAFLDEAGDLRVVPAR